MSILTICLALKCRAPILPRLRPYNVLPSDCPLHSVVLDHLILSAI